MAQSMINISKDFQYAINIAFDAEDNNKLKNYIFTAGALELFKKLFNSVIDDNTDKSHFLIGPYGKGKSHLALVLLNLLNLNNTESMDSVLKQIKLLDEEFYHDIKAFYNENKKVLPVIIENNGNTNLQQSFLLALKKALNTKGLESFIPDSYFSCAKDTIFNWEKNFSNTYELFKNKISCNISEFIDKLDNFDEKAYLEFTNIYPELTSGSIFYANVIENTVSFYQDVNKKLCKNGYKGIYVVFDEFSKYLEANIEKNTSDDLKFLQDFAEAANRSKKEQLHLLLITHQSLLNYVDKLTKTQIDNWKAVSNRFSELHLNTSISQYYKLISKIIIKDEQLFNEYKNKHKEELNNTNKTWKAAICYSDFSNNEFNSVASDVFPLHPASLYILPTLSEKIAQNERTIFTFLASDTQINTLHEFITRHDFNLENKVEYVTPDLLFDYFSPLFEEESFKSDIFKTNKKVIAALAQLPDSDDYNLHRKIIKTLGVLNIIKGTNVIPVTEETVCNIFNDNKTVEALKYLMDKKIIYRLEYAQTINFPEYADIDINSLIENRIVYTKQSHTEIGILNEYISHKAFYPVQYNEDFGLTRFFRFEFIYDKDISEEQFDNSIKNNFADGIIYYVLGDNTEYLENVTNKPALYIFNKNIPDNLTDFVYKYQAASEVKEKTSDAVTKEIIESIRKDYSNFIKNLCDSYFSFSDYTTIYISGKVENVKNKIKLSELLSKKLEAKYPNMPIILNEMVNKNHVTTQTIGRCKKILENLYERNKLLENLGFNAGSQENTIIKSVFVKNQLFYNNGESYIFEPVSNKVQDANINLYNTLQTINNYLENTDVTFEALYDKLLNEIGIRKGLLPLLIGAVLYNYKDKLYFLNEDIEYTVNSEVVYKIDEAPDSFVIKHINNDSETEKYLSELKNIFLDYISYTDKNLNENDRIVKGFAKWYVSLPSYTKTSITGIEKDLLKPLGNLHINTNEFLFEKMPSILGCKLSEISEKIRNIKLDIDSFITRKLDLIKQKMYELFGADNDSDLNKNISTWYQSLSPETKNHVFDDYTSTIFTLFEGEHTDIKAFICEIIVKDFGIRIEDWNKNYNKTGQDTCEYFIEKLNNFKLSYDKFEEKQNEIKLNSVQSGVNKISNSSYAIQFPGTNDDAIVKTFEFDNEQSKSARFLTNELKNIVGEYQDSLTAEEKCNVFFNVMKEILGI